MRALKLLVRHAFRADVLEECAEAVMPDGGARSATLETMRALSLTRIARETILYSDC